MGAQAPQWLLTSFVDAMQQIGATATDTDLKHEGTDLMQRWSAPNRQLHNLRRLMNTLTHIDVWWTIACGYTLNSVQRD